MAAVVVMATVAMFTKEKNGEVLPVEAHTPVATETRIKPMPPAPVTHVAVAEMRPGKVFNDCPDCPAMVIIPAGQFTMGSPASDFERPQHRVIFSEPFAIGRTEITRGQFSLFVAATAYSAGKCMVLGDNDAGHTWRNPGFTQQDNHPVVCISWNDAKAYVSWLATKTGQKYRLPSEAEWEYATRAGSTTERYWGDSPDQACGYANVSADRYGKGRYHNCENRYIDTAPIASYKPNAFGLYDTIGNVWEWTEDCWNGDYDGAPSDGSAWTTARWCDRRVLRGGGFGWVANSLRSASREVFEIKDDGHKSLGFRVARTLP